MRLPNIRRIGRYAFCILLVAAFFLLYEARLFQWQILQGAEFRQESLDDRTDVIELDGARGEILDRNGRDLAGNRTAYDIVFNALYDQRSQRNSTILKVIDILTEQEQTWRDILPIVVDEAGEYQFAADKEEEIASLKENLNLAEYATARECMDELSSLYGCVGYSTEDARTVASVRYSMTRDGYSRTTPYIVARDVSVEAVGIISQRAQELKGVEARVSVARYYGEDGSLAPHVVGHVGAISDTQYAAARENGTAYDYKENISGYKWTDSLGQDGLEGAFEKELRGQRGEETIYTDDTGALKSTAVTVPPREGNTVFTTLDSDLQRAANLSLKKNIEGNTLARNCTAGAAVVLNVKDFGVMACASYPTYDMNQFNSAKYYQSLAEDKTQPMFNRALQGIFVPGSIFKPLVATAALQEGVISAGTTHYCRGYFELADLTLGCLCGGGEKNVYSGLANSCNNFFATVGLDLRIARIDAYAEYFGLGFETGVELGEETGIIASPADYEERFPGQTWTDGVTAQAAIGQAANMFTPIQLATYCATIANGGKRLQTHFLEKVTDYTRREVIREYEPVEMFDAGISPDVIEVVKQGMIGTAEYGTASGVFGEYPVTVACKTGTAETSDPDDPDGTEANISMICYAPAENPEIAVAVMLEYGNKGDYAKLVAKDILDQYFGFYTWDAQGNRYDGATDDMVDDQGNVIKTKAQLDEEKAAAEQAEKEDFLSSALNGGAGDSSASSLPAAPLSTPSASSQSPETSAPVRNNVPEKPFTGEETSPSSSQPEDPAASSAASSAPPPSASGADSPYYSGG